MDIGDGLQRYVNIVLALVLTVVALYFGKPLILLFVVSGLLAFLLLPMARRMESIGLPRWAGALVANGGEPNVGNQIVFTRYQDQGGAG